ncbi:MAG: DUF3352 domain-containing protein [Planctomycetota bacterium]|nr:DUF3352 domain-containing protein [Planctomycetota bacterium]
MRLTRSLACLVVVAASFAPAAQADPFDQLLSDSTVLYVSIEDLAKTTERYKEGALFALYNDPAMQVFLEKPLQIWAAKMAKMKAEDGISPEDVFNVLTGQVAIVIPEVRFHKRGVDARPVVLADVRDAEKVQELIKQIEEILLKDDDVRRTEEEFRGVTIVHYARAQEEDEEKGAKKPDGPQCWYIDGKTLALAEKVDDLKAILARKGDMETPSLANHEPYRRVRARLGERADVVVFLNVSVLNKSLAEMPSDSVAMFRVISGLESVDGLGMQASLARDGLTMSMFISVPGAKQGLLKLFDAKNSPLQPPKWVPGDVSDVTTMSIDLVELMKEARNIEKKLGKEGTIDMLLETAKGMGVDIEKEIIASLGKEMTMFSRLASEGGNASMGFAIEVKDKPKLDGAIQKLLTVAQAWGLQTEDEDYLGVKIRTIKMGFLSIPIALLPDQFMVGSDVDLMKDVIRAYGKDVKGLIDADDYARGTAGLPEGRIMIGFTRFAKAVRATMLGVLLGAAPGVVDMSKFPKSEDIEKYLDVTTSLLINEENGIFYASRLAFKKAAEDD